MSGVLFDYPKQAAFGRVVPKGKIYEHAKPSRAIRERFVQEVDQVVWEFKLSPETTNLSQHAGVPEIQIFSVRLKAERVSEIVLRSIDKAISFPIVFELSFDQRIRSTAAYKRPSEAEGDKWVVDAYFETEWRSASEARAPLPVALDLGGLYEAMLLSHIGLPRRDGESMRAVVARAQEARAQEAECRRLETRLRQEQQFNRRVELNGQLRDAMTVLARLRD